MQFYSEKQEFEYKAQRQLYPEASFTQAGEKILMSWVMKYYRSGLQSAVHCHRYITKTGKLTRIIREKMYERSW